MTIVSFLPGVVAPVKDVTSHENISTVTVSSPPAYDASPRPTSMLQPAGASRRTSTSGPISAPRPNSTSNKFSISSSPISNSNAITTSHPGSVQNPQETLRRSSSARPLPISRLVSWSELPPRYTPSIYSIERPDLDVSTSRPVSMTEPPSTSRPVSISGPASASRPTFPSSDHPLRYHPSIYSELLPSRPTSVVQPISNSPRVSTILAAPHPRSATLSQLIFASRPISTTEPPPASLPASPSQSNGPSRYTPSLYSDQSLDVFDFDFDFGSNSRPNSTFVLPSSRPISPYSSQHNVNATQPDSDPQQANAVTARPKSTAPPPPPRVPAQDDSITCHPRAPSPAPIPKQDGVITYDTTPSPQSAGESELPRYTLEDFQVRGSCLKLEEQPDEKRKERKRIRRSKWLKVLVVLIVGLIITAIVLAVVLAKVK